MTEGYAADWTVEQLREPAQRVADRIDELIDIGVPGPSRIRLAPPEPAPKARLRVAGRLLQSRRFPRMQA